MPMDTLKVLLVTVIISLVHMDHEVRLQQGTTVQKEGISKITD